MLLNSLKYAQRERMVFLDQCFTWRGMANRKDLVDRFGVSMAQAALDFKLYLERLSENPPVYDNVRKTYLALENHTPLSPSIEDQPPMQILGAGGHDSFSTLPNLVRRVDSRTVALIYQAMIDGQAIHIQYTSMMTGVDDGQWIAPTKFASDGERVHLRAYSYKHDSYRDYVPIRISPDSSFALRPIQEPMLFDEEWHTLAKLHLKPKTGLSREQTIMVRREYGMEGDSLIIETRKALEFYAVRRWRLDHSNTRLELDKTEYETLLSAERTADG